jgi:hypothetical protein
VCACHDRLCHATSPAVLLALYAQVQDETEFGSSLSACPKLWQINCYKLWGLGGTLHELRLPECKEITLYRCAGMGAALL